jgi:hypothetical protein
VEQPSLDFPTVCALTGKLFLESRLEIERLASQVQLLREERAKDQEEIARLKAELATKET